MYNQKGSINIILVLLVVMMSMVIIGSFIVITRGSLLTHQTTLRAVQARYYAESCVEVALYAMYAEEKFSGTETLSFDDGSCSYVAIQRNPLYATIEATGTYKTNEGKVFVEVQLDPEIKISTWEVL